MKRLQLIVTTFILCTLMSISSIAGTWKSDAIGWWFANDDGSYPVNCWQWIDGNNDGIAECYYFDTTGYCLMNTVTPDACTVDHNGAWTVDGIVQTKVISAVAVPSAITEVTATVSVPVIQQSAPVNEISSVPYDGYTIVANTNTKKYHNPSCKSVRQMNDKNKGYCSSSDYLISIGYDPCQNCH